LNSDEPSGVRRSTLITNCRRHPPAHHSSIFSPFGTVQGAVATFGTVQAWSRRILDITKSGRYRSLYRTEGRCDWRICPRLFLDSRLFGYNHALISTNPVFNIFRRSRSFRNERRHETMKTNHEEMKKKKGQKNLCVLRFFVADFPRN
jgi:hypothetical protein